MNLILSLSLVLIAYYMAWRYSKTEADPDIAMFTLAGFTGAWYGRDFVDCKSPLVHLWFYAITRITGPDMASVKFLHHFLVGAASVGYYLISGDYWGALAFAVLINSGWLFAFTGNVGQVPAALILLALSITNPWIGCTLLVLAVLYEPKMLLTMAAIVILRDWYLPALAWIVVGLALAWLLYAFKREWFDWLIEANVIIPYRMNKVRPGLYVWSPWFTSHAMLYILPWVIAAVYANNDVWYWLPAVLYMVFISLGRVIRPHHLLPFVPWIAASGISPAWVLGLVCVDFLSSGLYLGDIWTRHYRSFIDPIRECKQLGERLQHEPGSLWVNGMHTEVYTYAQKFPMFGLVEQIEINGAAVERRRKMLAEFGKNPPDLVVETPEPNGVEFNSYGYELLITGNYTRTWRRKK